MRNINAKVAAALPMEKREPVAEPKEKKCVLAAREKWQRNAVKDKYYHTTKAKRA